MKTTSGLAKEWPSNNFKIKTGRGGRRHRQRRSVKMVKKIMERRPYDGSAYEQFKKELVRGYR